MNLPLFLARRIYGDEGNREKASQEMASEKTRSVSRPAIRIATIGVAIGLAVMIVTVSVILGFKHTIRDKVVGFGSHIQVMNVHSMAMTAGSRPVCIGDSMLQAFCDVEGVRHAARIVMTQGILKTEDDFLGVMMKGIGPEYDTQFLNECLLEGELPAFCDTATTYPLVISKTMADKLRLKVGDRVHAYFIETDDVRARRFTVSAVYQTNMKRFDDLICLTDLYTTQKLNGWTADECTGAELLVNDFSHLDETNRSVALMLKGRFDDEGNLMSPQTITSAYPQVFSWLELLDINVWIILALMIAVAGFTMISGLLIIILERTQMIGILKAQGMDNRTLRKVFLWVALFLTGKGILWGNLIGLAFCLVQWKWHIISLDPANYYLEWVPIHLTLPMFILINVGTIIITLLVLIGPSALVARIAPTKAIQSE